jgi:hypothetical protein
MLTPDMRQMNSAAGSGDADATADPGVPGTNESAAMRSLEQATQK